VTDVTDKAGQDVSHEIGVRHFSGRRTSKEAVAGGQWSMTSKTQITKVLLLATDH
jgi:hypothetical protein